MSMDGYNHMGSDPWASERAVYTKKIQSLEKDRKALRRFKRVRFG